MCGRFTLVAETEDIMQVFSIHENQYEHKPRANIAPSQTIAAIIKQLKSKNKPENI